MTGRNWKPGDVLVCDGARGIVTTSEAGAERARWVEFSDSECFRLDELPDSARPLAVIDPEDREQIERLSDLLVAQGISLYGLFDAVPTNGGVKRALRALITPPKPKEPTDPAARVKTSNGAEWAKVGNWWVCADPREIPRDWDDLVDLLDDSEATS